MSELPVVGLSRGFELRCGDATVAVPLSAQRLLAFLALHRRPLQRVYVAGTLWPESNDERAKASLRSALWRLQAAPCALVDATSSHVALCPELEVDVHRLAGLAQRALDSAEALTAYEIRELCVAGDLLPDWYDEWLAVERERFRQLRLHALEALCRQLTVQGRYAQATEVALAAIATEPLRESAHRALIDVHLAERNLSEAVRHYETYRWLVATELGAEPSSELHRMVVATAALR